MPGTPQFNHSRTGSERCPAVDVAFLTENRHLFVLFQSAGNSLHGQKEVPYARRPRISFLSTSCYSSKVLGFVFRHAQSQSWSFLTARKSDTLVSSLCDVLVSQNIAYWKQQYASDAVQKIARFAAMFGSVVYSHQPRVTQTYRIKAGDNERHTRLQPRCLVYL